MAANSPFCSTEPGYTTKIAQCRTIFRRIDTTSSDGDEQLPPFTTKGVGTHALDRLSGAHRSGAQRAPPHVHGVHR
jgi:hypothetical protein